MFVPVREMDNFYVFGSNRSFPSSHFGAIMDGAHQLCGQYPGTPPVGEISWVTCEPHPLTARYVFIQVDRQETPGVLELCEVWVYESKSQHTLLAKKVVTPPLKTIKPMWIELLCFNLAEIGMIWTRDCSPTKSDTTLDRHSMQGQVGSSTSETTV